MTTTDKIHQTLRDSAGMRWLVLLLLAFAMFCSYIFILIENNVNNLIDEMYRRGYRKFSMTRTDKERDKLSEDERVRGGMPSTSENVSQMINAAIESFVENNVGSSEMYFNATLEDWLAFDETESNQPESAFYRRYID